MKELVYLSKKLRDKEKDEIASLYYHSRTKELSKDLQDKLDSESKKFLDNYYRKKLGDSWKEIVEKYNVKLWNINIICEKPSYKNSLVDKFFREYYISWESSEKYPHLKDDIKVPKKKRDKIVKILYDILSIKNGLVQEMIDRNMVKIEDWRIIFFPDINTFEDLSIEYPDIFDIYLQNLAEKSDVKVVSRSQEVDTLKKVMC